MMKFVLAAPVAAALFAVSSLSAQAQVPRTWVAGSNGNDANPCSRSQPCATFGTALAATIAGGEINVIDGGGFGTLSINKSVTIQNDGAGTAGILHSMDTGITVNGPGIVVTLRGLDFFGNGTGLRGVRFMDGSALHIENCTFRNSNAGNGFGIEFMPFTGPAALFVSDTVITNNGSGSTGGGILIRPTGSTFVNATLTRVEVKNNASGFKSDASVTTGFISMAIRDSTAASNTQHGVWALGGSFGTDIFIQNSMINSNALNGLRAENSGARIFYAGTTITNNGVGLAPLSGGQLISNGTNRNRANYAQGAPTSTQAQD